MTETSLNSKAWPNYTQSGTEIERRYIVINMKAQSE